MKFFLRVAGILALAGMLFAADHLLSPRDSIIPPLSPPKQQEQEQEEVTGKLPVRVKIPKITVDAPIITVGLTADGAMDIPRAAADVGWFTLGYLPGDNGNAVFAGHLDTLLTTAGVFRRLGSLKLGDTVEVETASGTLLTFVVERSESYPYDRAPMEEIFGPSDVPRLNLITCTGVWNRHTYTRRLVVYTRLEEEE